MSLSGASSGARPAFQADGVTLQTVAGVSSLANGAVKSLVASIVGASMGGSVTRFIPLAYTGATASSIVQGGLGTEADARMPFPFACRIVAMYIDYAATAANQGFTATLRINGLDSAITLTIPSSHAAAQLPILAQNVAVAAGDDLDLKVVAGSDAALINFRCSIQAGFP